MSHYFFTIYESCEAEISIKKSKFICQLFPVESEEAVKEIIDSVKKAHYNANHHCVAFRIGKNNPLERSSDDGEPSKTAGLPMLEVLRGANLTNVLAVVIRYFGGTKLGTGGLVRAYTEAIQAGLEKAIVLKKEAMSLMSIAVPYTLSGKMDYAIHEEGYIQKEIQYTEQVIYLVYIGIEEEDMFQTKMMDLTAGQCKINRLKQVYVYQVLGETFEENLYE